MPTARDLEEKTGDNTTSVRSGFQRHEDQHQRTEGTGKLKQTCDKVSLEGMSDTSRNVESQGMANRTPNETDNENGKQFCSWARNVKHL